VVPAGTGGGADQMARLILGIVIKHKLMKEPLIVVNKSGGAGAEGFLASRSQGRPAQDHHHAVEPVHDADGHRRAVQLEGHDPGRDDGARPVRALGQRRRALQDASEYIAAVKAAGPNKFKMGGTGSKQEDQIITVGIEMATGTKFIYVPFKGGGEVACSSSGGHVDIVGQQPDRGPSPSGAPARLRPVRVRRPSHALSRKWYRHPVLGRHPTCKEAGVPTDYVMLRRHLHAPASRRTRWPFYVDLLKKVRGDLPTGRTSWRRAPSHHPRCRAPSTAKWLEGEPRRSTRR
jgi:tripartite-type tricarboxylate transporter receptor subunit TctC